MTQTIYVAFHWVIIIWYFNTCSLFVSIVLTMGNVSIVLTNLRQFSFCIYHLNYFAVSWKVKRKGAGNAIGREMFNLSRQRIILWSLANTIQVGQPQGNQPPTSTPTGGHSTRRKERIADGFSWLISMLSVLDRSETISMSATVMLIYR